MAVDLKILTSGTFAPHRGEGFELELPDGRLPLTLAEVQDLGHGVREGGAFSLLFLGEAGGFLPQAIYPLDHPQMGRIELFLVPLGPRPDGNAYEAIFT